MIWKCLPLCVFPFLAHAQLAYDGFRPETGYSERAGKNGSLGAQQLKGPAGWGGVSWSVKGSELFVFREDAGLVFPAITYPGGGGVQIAPIDASARSRGRDLDPAIPFAGRTSLYMSFLLRVDAPDCGGTAWAAFENAGGNGLGLGAGVHEGNLVLLSRTARGERVLQALGPAAPQTVYYFIIKLSDSDGSWKGSDDLEIWVNPADVSGEAKATETAELHFLDASSHNASSEVAVARAMLYVENFDGDRVFFDELALGETFSEVTAPKAERQK
jgi:hypothetical protein